jgi:RNA polymerase sigma factor (sigma-70 family)
MNEIAIVTRAKEKSPSYEDHENWKAEIVEVIDQLTEQERLVVALHFNEELTVPEIAQVLDIPISKVKKIYNKVLKQLLNI